MESTGDDEAPAPSAGERTEEPGAGDERAAVALEAGRQERWKTAQCTAAEKRSYLQIMQLDYDSASAAAFGLSAASKVAGVLGYGGGIFARSILGSVASKTGSDTGRFFFSRGSTYGTGHAKRGAFLEDLYYEDAGVGKLTQFAHSSAVTTMVPHDVLPNLKPDGSATAFAVAGGGFRSMMHAAGTRRGYALLEGDHAKYAGSKVKFNPSLAVGASGGGWSVMMLTYAPWTKDTESSTTPIGLQDGVYGLTSRVGRWKEPEELTFAFLAKWPFIEYAPGPNVANKGYGVEITESSGRANAPVDVLPLAIDKSVFPYSPQDQDGSTDTNGLSNMHGWFHMFMGYWLSALGIDPTERPGWCPEEANLPRPGAGETNNFYACDVSPKIDSPDFFKPPPGDACPVPGAEPRHSAQEINLCRCQAKGAPFPIVTLGDAHAARTREHIKEESVLRDLANAHGELDPLGQTWETFPHVKDAVPVWPLPAHFVRYRHNAEDKLKMRCYKPHPRIIDDNQGGRHGMNILYKLCADCPPASKVGSGECSAMTRFKAECEKHLTFASVNARTGWALGMDAVQTDQVQKPGLAALKKILPRNIARVFTGKVLEGVVGQTLKRSLFRGLVDLARDKRAKSYRNVQKPPHTHVLY